MFGVVNFTDRLKELRLKNGFSQSIIAKEIGVSETQYQNYEYGKHEPKLKYLIALADFYKIDLDYLTGRTDNPKINK